MYPSRRHILPPTSENISLIFPTFGKYEIYFEKFPNNEIFSHKFQTCSKLSTIQCIYGKPLFEKWFEYNHMGIAHTTFDSPRPP